MDIKLLFAIVGIVIGVGSFVPYLRDVFSFKTRPHIYSWLIWLITEGTATLGAWYGGGGYGAINLTVMCVFIFGVFVISLKYGTKNITTFDTIVLVMAMLAILAWWGLHQPLLSIIMVSAIDVIGYVPSFRKSFQEPWSETVVAWVGFVVANMFALLALSQHNFLTMTYLISISSANVVLILVCLARRPFIKKPN